MLEAQRAGERYLRSLPGEMRRDEGRVYTPPHLVRFLLEQASKGKPLFEEEAVSVLDPACGAGAFLSALVDELAESFRRRGVNVASKRGRLDFADAVERQIYGIDIDSHACALSVDSVRAAVARLTLAPVSDGFFARNVLNADFLMSEEVQALNEQIGGFDYIIGNPPYVATTRLSGFYKDSLRLLFETADGRLDLYTLFMEKSIRLLSQGGRLVFITPDKFLISRTSSSLRSLILREMRIHTVARFRSHRVFENAATVPCVSVLERSAERGSVEILSCDSMESPPGSVAVQSHHFLPQATLGRDAWQLLPAADLKLLGRLKGDHPTLEQLSIRISAGPATGRDGVFILTADLAAKLEPELLRPAIRGRDILPYHLADSGLRIIVPYEYSSSGSASLVDLSRFPRVKAWLDAHRVELEARHCVREWQKRWYDLHDQTSHDLARRTKILVPDVATGNRFAVDTGRFFPLHSAYYILLKDGVDPHYVTAVLNSRICEYLIRLHAPRVKDGFIRYRQQFLSTLPIPIAEASLQNRIVAASQEADGVAAEKLVCRLFGLSSRVMDELARAVTLSRESGD